MQAQIDGNVVRAKFTLPPRQKLSPPPKPIAAAPKRDAPKTDNASADAEKDGPKRQRERMACIRLLSLHILFILYNHHELMPVFTILCWWCQLLPIGNLWLHLEGGRLLLEGVDLLDIRWILHHADVQILLVVAE